MMYEIVQDVTGINPFTEYDRLGYLITTSERYGHLADETYKYGYYSLLVSLAGEYQNLNTDRFYWALNVANERHYYGMYGIDLSVAQADAQAIIESVFDKYYISVSADHIAPGSLYYVRIEDVLKEYSRKNMSKKLRKHVEKILDQELSDLSAYLEGEVYGWEVRDENGYCVDSCYGYYGETGRKYAEEEAKHSMQELSKQGVC